MVLNLFEAEKGKGRKEKERVVYTVRKERRDVNVKEKFQARHMVLAYKAACVTFNIVSWVN